MARPPIRAFDERLSVGGDAAAVEAFVLDPPDGEIRGGILFLHWLGDHRSDRSQFLAEARDYARMGIRSVLPAGNLPWLSDPVDAETDLANIALEQRHLGAAVARLTERLPKGAPLALVGHDFGAMHGLGLLARTTRFKAAVLIAATPRWGDWFLRFWKVDVDRFDYLRRLAPVDPVSAARSVSARLLWQASERDFFIAPMSTIELARAAPGDPVIEWYQADHAMRSSKARAARRAFLRRELALD